MGTAGKLFKGQEEESSMRKFTFYEKNAGLNLKDILKRKWEGIRKANKLF